MKIEVGKSYRTRDGSKMLCIEHIHGDDYPYTMRCGDGLVWSYNTNGVFDDTLVNKYDLIAEWEETMEETKCGLNSYEPEEGAAEQKKYIYRMVLRYSKLSEELYIWNR